MKMLVTHSPCSMACPQVSITPIKDRNGAVTQYVAVQQDSTARKAAEAAFQLRDYALSNLSEGIMIADPNLPDNPIVYVNEAFCRITGYSREEVLGRNWRLLQVCIALTC